MADDAVSHHGAPPMPQALLRLGLSPAVRPQMGPHIRPPNFGDRIGLDMDLVPELAVVVRHVLIGLREASPKFLIEPIVVTASQPARLDSHS